MISTMFNTKPNTMLKRKVIDQLSAWKADPQHKPVILKGCRQCGKTFAAQYFAHNNS